MNGIDINTNQENFSKEQEMKEIKTDGYKKETIVDSLQNPPKDEETHLQKKTNQIPTLTPKQIFEQKIHYIVDDGKSFS